MGHSIRYPYDIAPGIVGHRLNFSELQRPLALRCASDLAYRRHVAVGGAEVKLTPIEYKLLATLVRHAGKVLTHRQLLREVWGPSHDDQAHYVRVYMGHLRQKLEAEAARPRYLLTEPGVGYRLAAE